MCVHIFSPWFPAKKLKSLQNATGLIDVLNVTSTVQCWHAVWVFLIRSYWRHFTRETVRQGTFLVAHLIFTVIHNTSKHFFGHAIHALIVVVWLRGLMVSRSGVMRKGSSSNFDATTFPHSICTRPQGTEPFRSFFIRYYAYKESLQRTYTDAASSWVVLMATTFAYVFHFCQKKFTSGVCL